MARVDIVIPTFKHARFLDECFGMLAAQTMPDWRAYVMDDASPDETPEIVARWSRADPRIVHVRHEENIGIHQSLMRGATMGDADFLVLLCDDDLWAPDFLGVTGQALQAHPQVAVAYTNWMIFRDVGGQRVGFGRVPTVPVRPSGIVHDRDLLLAGNWIPLPFGVIRRRCFDEVGGLDPNFQALNDYDLWLRLAVRWPFHFTEHALGLARDHESNGLKNFVATGRGSRDHLLIGDALQRSEVWPAHSKFVAKAWQIQELTGFSIFDIAEAMLGQSDEVHRKVLEPLSDEFRCAIAEAVLLIPVKREKDRALGLLSDLAEAGGACARRAASLHDAAEKLLLEGRPADSGRRPFTIVAGQPDPERLAALLGAYLQAFGGGDAVELRVVFDEADLPDVQAVASQVIGRLGLDPEQVPEVVLQERAARPLEEWLRSADLVVGSETVVQQARLGSLPAFSLPSCEDLQIALHSFRALQWRSSPLALGDLPALRWLVTDATRWEQALEDLLDEPGTALILCIPSGSEQAFGKVVEDWLVARGRHGPAQPALYLVGTDGRHDLRLFRTATAWWDDGDPLARAIARALGIEVIQPGRRSAVDR